MIVHNNWVLGDIELHDLITTCKKDLKAGAYPVYNGCRWVLSTMLNGNTPTPPGGNQGGGTP